LTAWKLADGGYISADAPNVDESAAAITRQTSMLQNTMRAPAIPLSRASNTGRIGSTITVQENSLPGLSYQAPTLIHWTNLCLDRLDGCPQNGNRSFTNKVRVGIWWEKSKVVVCIGFLLPDNLIKKLEEIRGYKPLSRLQAVVPLMRLLMVIVVVTQEQIG